VSDIWRRDEIESPCVKVCVIHPGSGLCVGCLRSRDEIGAWSAMTPAARRAVMDALPTRAPLLTAPEARPSRRRRAQQDRGAQDQGATSGNDGGAEGGGAGRK
jgi:predicted Fe-S protein YdhL (DUF1289 family)